MRRRPDWISESGSGSDSIGRWEPEIAIQMARYGSKFPYRPTLDARGNCVDPDSDPRAHLYQLVTAQFFTDVRTIPEWRACAENYPDTAIGSDQAIQQTNPNAAVRAYYLREALTRLLELAKAPEPMKSDLRAMLEYLIPVGAETRAKVQKAILEDPGASLQQIADQTGADAGQISKDGKAGLLIWPADPVGGDLSGIP